MRCLLVMLLLAMATSAQAAALSGRVTDSTGAGLSDAVVTVPELHLRAVTRADGGFDLPVSESGTYTLVVKRNGYAPQRLSFASPQTAPLQVTLTATPFEIEPVQVTASRSAIDPDRSPLPTATLSGDRLQREHTVSLAHAIEELPGMSNLSTGGQVGKPVVRGLEGPRVLVLEDGYRLEDYSWSDEDGPSVDAWLTDRVEVVRGPASVLYGSDALAGVVNAVPADLPSAANGSVTRAGAGIYGASNNSEFGTALKLEHASGGFGGRLFLVGRHGDDLHTPDGEIPNTGFGAFSGETELGLRGKTSWGTLRGAHYGGEFKLLEANASPGESEEGGPERKSGDNRVQFDGNLLLGGIRFESKAQWQQHSLIEVADEGGDSTSTPGQETEQFNLLLDTYELDLLAHHGKGEWTGTLGVTGLAQTNDTRGPIPLVPDSRMLTGSGYAFEEFQHDRWSVLGGLRIDQRHLEADNNLELALSDQSRDDMQASLQGGAVYRLSDKWIVSANTGRGWRAPSLFELYSNGPHLGEARYELGDPTLVPEGSFELDGGIKLRGTRARAELTGFRNEISNYIFVAPDGTARVVGTDTLAVYAYQQANARLVGGEFRGELEATPSITVRLRGDYVSGQNLELDQPLPLIPPFRTGLEGEIHSSKLSWAERANAGAEMEYVANQNRLGAFDVATGSHTLVHLDAGMDKRLGERSYRFDLRVRNVMNTAYREFMSRYKRFADDQGRNIVLQISTGL